jgi:hypothetical protein
MVKNVKIAIVITNIGNWRNILTNNGGEKLV